MALTDFLSQLKELEFGITLSGRIYMGTQVSR